MMLSLCAIITCGCLVYMILMLREEKRIVDDEHQYMTDSLTSLHAKIDFVQTHSIDLHRMIAEMNHTPKRKQSVKVIKNEKKDY